jgi:hypothetical protein
LLGSEGLTYATRIAILLQFGKYEYLLERAASAFVVCLDGIDTIESRIGGWEKSLLEAFAAQNIAQHEVTTKRG